MASCLSITSASWILRKSTMKELSTPGSRATGGHGARIGYSVGADPNSEQVQQSSHEKPQRE